MPSTQDAEDFTAEAFIRLWERRSQQDSMEAVAAFLHVTVRNKCFDWLRREQRWAERLKVLEAEQGSTDPFAAETVHQELLQKIYAEVERLPTRLKEIFLLSYQQGLKPAEIAEQLNLSVQTVKNQRLTALRLLKIALAEHSAAVIILLLLENTSLK